MHSDLCQVNDASLGNAKYFVTFLDDYSRKIFVYFIKSKNETCKVFKHFIRYVENQNDCKVKVLRSDNGRKYINQGFKSILDEAGIKHETSVPHNPQQNRQAERINRILLEKARCMLAESKLPSKFWAEAIATAAYLSNRSPKRSLNGATPEELWTGNQPDLSHLRTFGCKSLAHILDHVRSKI